MYFNWLQSLLQKSSPARRATTKRRPYVSEVETLETRVVPAIYTVTGYADGVGATTANGANFNSTTLRAALAAANATPDVDTIVLSAGTYTINTEGEGQLEINSDLTISGAGAGQTIINNAYAAGRVFYIHGIDNEVALEDLQITGGNATDGLGGGIYLVDADLSLTRSSVVGNRAQPVQSSAFGGGIYVYGGTLTVTDSTIAGNEAYGSAYGFGGYQANGGGIATRFGIVTIRNSTISGNIAVGGTASSDFAYGGSAAGGGIWDQFSSLTVNNSTIANNHAFGGQSTNGGEGFGGRASGGGVYSYGGSPVFYNSTIAFNQANGGIAGTGVQTFRTGAGVGGGVNVYTGFEDTGTVGSTIIAKNESSSADADVTGTFVDADYNLIGNVGSATGWDGLNSLIGGGNALIDPLFATTGPVDNGGPTLTLALASGSPAIDAGSNAREFGNDQRGSGFARVVGGGADIGAFEVQSIAVATSAGSTPFTAGGAAVVVDSGVTISGSDDLTGATVSITSNFLSTEDSLIYPVQIGNITGSYLDGVLTLTGNDSVENYLLALQSITYLNSSLAPTGTTRGVTYSVTDAEGTASSLEKTVTITILNSPPTVQNAIPPQTAIEDTAFTFTFAANTFGDVNQGDTLTYTATGLPSWLSFDGATRTFTGTPANGDVTTTPLTITVTATDGSEATVSTTFALTVVNTNDAPTVSVEIPPQTAIEDTAFSFTFDIKTFVDVDLGDTLTYTASGLPAWLSFDGATRTFSGTPGNSDVTTTPLTITVTATDSSLASVSTTFALTVENVNDAPTVVHPIPNQFAPLNALFSFTFAANTFADIDVGDTLTYSVTGLPAWLSFDAASRTFTGTPTAGDAGSLSTITVTATDNHEASVSTTFDVTVGSIGPNITVTENQGTYYLGKVRAFYDPTAGFTNPGSEVPDYSAAKLTVSIVAGRSSRDVLSILSKGQDGPIRVKGKNIFYGDVKIGTVSGGKGRQPNLVVTFNAQTTTASIDALMRRVNFTAKDDLGTVRTVHSQVTNVNNGGLETVDSNVATRDIQVVRTNGPQ